MKRIPLRFKVITTSLHSSGLAAALQARVLAQLKVKEESEERQRISDESSHSRTHPDVPLTIASAPQPQQIKTDS